MRRQELSKVAAILAIAILIGVWAGPTALASDNASILVQGRSPEQEVAQAVSSAGGEITHRLGIIDAVAARLTAEQRERLAADPRVTRLWDDHRLGIATGSVVRDEFGSASYSGSDGTASWAGPWQEEGEADGPGDGRLQVVPGNKCASSKCLEIGGSGVGLNGFGLRRGADLQGVATAKLSFSYRRQVTAAGDGRLSVQISDDAGASWSTIAIYELSASDAAHVAESFDVTAWAAAGTDIRFLGSGRETGAVIYLDDVELALDGSSDRADDTFRDEFTSGGYSGDYGSASWSGPWVETEVPGQNSVFVASGNKCFAGNCLQIQTLDVGTDVSRRADLSQAAAASLTFYYEHVLGGGGD